MTRALSVAPALLVFFAGCGGDAKRAADATTPGDSSADGADASDDATAPDTAPTGCAASLTEVNEDFIEVVAHGDCADWSISIRDGAVQGCTLAAQVFFPHDQERMALQGFQVPAEAVIMLQDPQLRTIGVWTLGTCEPDASCLGFTGEGSVAHKECLPADDANGSVSLCGAQWVAGKTATPGAENDCACAVDCQKAAGFCQTGRCVDGACAFDARGEGESCDDGNHCTNDDCCSGGACVGDAVVCSPPAGPCEQPGACSPETGQCVYVDNCAENAECGADGCACRAGFTGDGVTSCTDVDECHDGSAQCDPTATCVNQQGGYFCVCPIGFSGDGRTCAPSDCACPWESNGACGPELRSLRVRVVDLWAQPVYGASVSIVDVPTGQVILANQLDGWEVDEPLCGARDFRIAVEAPDHHAFAGTINWLENDITITSEPSSDAAWAITWDDQGPVVWVGLAHKWYASSGRPARHGNRVELMMDGEVAWSTVYAELQAAQHLVTGSSWEWTSGFEIVRPEGSMYLDPQTRWHNTILGALEDLPDGVDRKIMVWQLISQDGLLSNETIDDELLAHAETPADDFEYMGMANTVSGTFTVTPPSIDFAGRVVAAQPNAGELIDEAPADPWHQPIAVDMTDLPLGLGVIDWPLASWHQKFWTIDQQVAFVGGMNAKTTDWDTSEHKVFDERRMSFDASTADREAVQRKEKEPDFPPRKDYMMRLEGPIVQDVVDVFDRRWQHQLDAHVDYSDYATPIDVEPTTETFADDMQAQIVATMPAPFDENAILETVMRAVSNAKHFIYIEDQYFRAPILYDRIIDRMTQVPGLQVIVITNEVSEWSDPACYQTAIAYQRFHSLFPGRFRLYRLRAFDYVRTDCTFCWDETEAHFVNFDLHSKMVMVDDEYMEIGSCNSNNRGYLYEGELGTAIHDPEWVAAQRKRIFENILGPGYQGDMPFEAILPAFDERAAANDHAYARWDDEGMDLDLNGDPVPGDMIPSGFLYTMSVDVPDECLIEGVGSDIT